MATLIEISEELLLLADVLDEATGEDGEIDPTVAAQLDEWFAELSQDRDDKLDNYGALVREMTLRAAARREEMERLKMRVEADENKVKYLKQRLLEFLDAQKTPKVETRRYKFLCCGNGGVQAVDMSATSTELLPKEYQKIEVRPDTDKIRETLLAGGSVPGCVLKPRGRHVRIS